MRLGHRLAGLYSLLALLPAACTGGGAVQTTADDGDSASFQGETIHFIVSFAPGGGYDAIARAIAPHLEKQLGATVVVENQDGAGGLVAANQVYSAEPDGLTIGFFGGQGMAGAALAGAEGVRFDLLDISYVTRLAAEQRVMVTGARSEYETIEEIRTGQGVEFASAGTGANDNIDANVLYSVLGIDGRIVTGYEGSEETELAITSGDVDIGSGSIPSKVAGVKSGDFVPALIIGDEKSQAMPDVPTLTELDLENEKLAQAHLNLQDMGRMVWAPPGVPESRLAVLEDAFRAASKNPEFLAKMRKAEQPIDFTSGDQARAVAEDVLDAPKRYKALLKKAFAGQ